MDTAKLGSFLKALRKEHNLTQEQLAEKLGVTNRTVSRWETGTHLPDLDILIALSELYQIDIRELLNGERASTKMQAEDKEVLQQVAEYGTMKAAHIMRRIFLLAVIGVTAVGCLYYTTIKFFHDVTNGEMVSLSLTIAFLIYSLIMQAFPNHRSSDGYLFTLASGFLAVIVSNNLILCLFFGGGSYHNYGLMGVVYITAVIIGAFLVTGILTGILIRNQVPSNRNAT